MAKIPQAPPSTCLARLCAWLALSVAATGSTGCALGPRQIYFAHQKYNEAIKDSFCREMLLNLVRLKYRETPEFVDIGGVAAQYSFDGTARIDGGFVSGLFSLDKLAPGATLNRSERPTITYAPSRGKDFERNLLTPINVSTIGVLTNQGWSADRLLRLSTRSLNFLDNAISAGGPTPTNKPEFEAFLRASSLMRELQKHRGLEFVFAKRDKRTRVLPGMEKIDGAFMLAALDKGYTLDRDPDGTVVLVKTQNYPAIVIHPQAITSPEVVELTRLLNLEPNRPIYEFSSLPEGRIITGYPKEAFKANDGVKRTGLARQGEAATALPDPLGEFVPNFREDIAVQSRSVYEMMYYLSQGVSVPEEHIRKGFVNITLDERGVPFEWSRLLGGLFCVKVARVCPIHSYLAVHYRGYWYYISDDDLDSKSTMGLLQELFNIEVRGGNAAASSNVPVLTLGVGK